MSALTVVTFCAGLVLLIIGAELLVRGAVRLAAGFGVSPLVIGLTVVSFGTTSAELAVSLSAGLAGEGDLVVGNIVGSTITNVLLILGLAAAISPLIVQAKLVRVDVPLAITAGVGMYLLGLDGAYGRADGLLLFAGIIAYLLFTVYQSRRESRDIQQEFAAEFGEEKTGLAATLPGQLALIVVGLAGLLLGSRWLVTSATAMARGLGVSDLVIGLTIVSIGTSAPELATALLATLRGERDIAVGNAIGGSIFNLLAVLGVTAAVSPLPLEVPPAALRVDIPIMLAALIACLPIFFVGHRIARWEGFLFLGYYLAYLLYLLLASAEHDALPRFSAVMLEFVVPLTIITLIVSVVRSLRANSRTARV